MKKAIALILTLCTLLCTLTACHSCRSKYLPEDTDTDTLPESETEEDAGGGVLADYAYGTNPYAGMSQQELVDLFWENYNQRANNLQNTPFYHVLDTAKGGLAYSKLTGEFVTLCKDPLCDHRTCIFHDGCFDYAHAFSKDRIYFITKNNPYEPEEKYILYSFTYTFDDPRIEYTWPTTDRIEHIFYDDYNGGTIFYQSAYRENKATTQQVYALDLTTLKVSLLDWPYKAKPGELFYLYMVQNGKLYYNTRREDDIHCYNLSTGEDKCLVHTSILRPEDGETSADLQWVEPDERFIHISTTVQNGQRITTTYWRYDTETGERTEEKTYSFNCSGYEIYFVDHTTEAYKDDPFYDYYVFDRETDDLFTGKDCKFGGEVFIASSDGSQDECCMRLSTDGIPENFSDLYSDGKCLFIRYMNYKTWTNEYNILKDPFENWYLNHGYMIVDPLTQVVRGAGSAHDIEWYPDRH